MSASPVTLDFSKARPITPPPTSAPAQPEPQPRPQAESVRNKLISLGGRFLGAFTLPETLSTVAGVRAAEAIKDKGVPALIGEGFKTVSKPFTDANKKLESNIEQSSYAQDIKHTIAEAEANPQKFMGEKVAPYVIGAVGPGEFGAGALMPHMMPELGEGAANDAGKLALQELGKKYKVTGVTKDVLNNPSFIAPNGQIIDLGDTWHPAALQNLSDEASRPYKNLSAQEEAREKFLNDSNTIRLRPRMDRGDQTLHATVPKNGISEAQADTLRQAVGQMRYGNLLTETADTPSISRSEYKEFARPSDVDNMLKRIGAHPSQKATRVSQKIGNLEGATLVKSRENPEIAPWSGEGKIADFPGRELGGKISKIQQVPINKLVPTEEPDSTTVSSLQEEFLHDTGKEIPALTVEDNGDGTYSVLDGHSRLAAAKAVGLTEAPVRIYTSPDDLKNENSLDSVFPRYKGIDLKVRALSEPTGKAFLDNDGSLVGEGQEHEDTLEQLGFVTGQEHPDYIQKKVDNAVRKGAIRLAGLGVKDSPLYVQISAPPTSEQRVFLGKAIREQRGVIFDVAPKGLLGSQKSTISGEGTLPSDLWRAVDSAFPPAKTPKVLLSSSKQSTSSPK